MNALKARLKDNSKIKNYFYDISKNIANLYWVDLLHLILHNFI